ncbi:response regulator [Chelatococcus composti]|jgi:two-component system chemotaxis response regulator CheY|uniref:Two-component system chemotaxis response regulator CheY n=1 Tax=Chelatococcus composti TaxID=1743235 RepID=A0A841K6I9_9HYPH|nr:response regulator [Chelatococcus composti]MBB6167670.1 two-component system chemotaxis response regulator CheY [Chelatococcus composti]MBS7735129.1 response regulator [Chelatococcus composti]PZN43599.1 MAG: two-component system response regulator [Pseudomonadota bacterium]GGG36908.1 response regulator [Chelatococcus composti]
MKTCLVVDDSPFIRKVARKILEELSFEVSEAGNGQEALDHCMSFMPDAILLDWNMPVLDGPQFLEAVRAMEGGNRPKIVFCTTENDPGHIARALIAGADEYIMKPFDREILTFKFQEVGLIEAEALADAGKPL